MIGLISASCGLISITILPSFAPTCIFTSLPSFKRPPAHSDGVHSHNRMIDTGFGIGCANAQNTVPIPVSLCFAKQVATRRRLKMRANIHFRNVNDSTEQEWLTRTANFVVNGDRSKIEQMVSHRRDGQACKLIQQIHGAFNYCIKIRFDNDHQEWMLRFPKPGCAMKRAEKSTTSLPLCVSLLSIQQYLYQER